MAVPRIALADLQLPRTSIVSPAYATAAEKLAVGLGRTGLAVIVLPAHTQAAALRAGLQALLASGTSSLPGCNVREWRAGSPAEAAAIEEAYGVCESTARLVLSALCRSTLLRLRADAFSQVLDDLPLSRSAQGSSVLAAKAYQDNFRHLTAAESSTVLPLFADPQEEVSERGLVSLVYAQEASDPQAGQMSAMQVRDSNGRWQDVTLAPCEVAVVLGYVMQHATGGLLRPATHRVVGDPYGSSGGSAKGRRLLHFELRPRPSATLDLRPQLEAAGHMISSRFSPVSVRSLMEQFEALMSPACKVATPDQQAGAAAHAAWEELQASLKKGKKRISAADELPDASLPPVTRSGNVRRSSEGLVGRRPSSRQKQQQAGRAEASTSAAPSGRAGGCSSSGGSMQWEGGQRPTSADSSGGSGFSLGSGSQRRASLEPASSALYIVRGRTCTVVDRCLQDDPAQCITICVRSFTGLERWFYVNASANCGCIFEMYCARLGIPLGAVRFLLRGERVFGASTPASCKMRDGEELVAVPESSDRLQQARELGPLFAAVFGSAAVAGLSSVPELL